MQQKYQKGELLAILKEKYFDVSPGIHMKRQEKCLEVKIPLKTPEIDKIE